METIKEEINVSNKHYTQYSKFSGEEPMLINDPELEVKEEIVEENIEENDKSKQAQRLIDNVKWYNEVCRVEPVLTESPSTITLTYNSKYRARDYGIILNLPITFKSAYSSICDSIIHYIDEQKEQNTLQSQKVLK